MCLGCPKDIKDIAQISGRAGRDGGKSIFVLIHTNVTKDKYITTQAKAYILQGERECKHCVMIKRYHTTTQNEERKLTESDFCCDFGSSQVVMGPFDALQYAILKMANIDINCNILFLLICSERLERIVCVLFKKIKYRSDNYCKYK